MAAELCCAAISGVASKVAESMFEPIGMEISYVFKSHSYIDDLKKQEEEQRNKRQRIEVGVDHAKRQGEEVYEDVDKWLICVDTFTEGVVKPIIGDEDNAKQCCFKGLCPNFFKRYMLNKESVKAAKDGADLLGKGNFSSVSYRPALQRTESKYVKGYEAFNSRMPVLKEIIEALKDASIDMIGVYGMGGVGKTTLVKKAAWQADKLFDKVVMVEVTQNPDHNKIQEKIAYDLGMEFGQESEFHRVGRLYNRLKKEKRVLVILDDIWTKLDLEAIGIPVGDVKKASAQPKEKQEVINDDQRQCRILLTSRRRDVLCKDMKTQKNILVSSLSYEDSWNLFGKIVGDYVEKSDFYPIAVEIVKKCSGLPVAISTIANALKTESLHSWEDTLKKLERSNPRCILDMNETLFSTIELSYNFLKDEEAKSLFLLCGLHNASENISIDYLLRYGMGLGLFQNVYTLKERRNRVHSLINYLKASCLLLDGDTDENIKMHDIIHAVAVSIASNDKLMVNIPNVTASLTEVLEDKTSKASTTISLPHRDIHDELPERMDCPNLKLFLLFMKNDLSLRIPDLFFKTTDELKVLSFTKIHFQSLPSSLYCLTNLKTLCLEYCLLGDIAMIGELKNLEILSFSNSDIEQLPGEIGQLIRLRLLDLKNCSNLKVIAPNVISSLSRLEELYMGNSFVHWEVEGFNNQGRRNASLSELKELPHLTTLEIHVKDAQIMPHQMFVEKWERYKIFIGDVWSWSGKYDTIRTLKLEINNSISLRYGIKMLLKRAEDLYLDKLNGVKNVLYELDWEGFPKLKHLHVRNGLELLYIVDSAELAPCNIAFPMLESLFLYNLINLVKICHDQLYAQSFSKLRIIRIEKCNRLKHLFSTSMMKNLSQLQEIKVVDCQNLKEIFGKESEQHLHQNGRNSKIEFSQLRSLTLECLPQLMSFVFGMKPPIVSQTTSRTRRGSKEIIEEDEPEDFVPLFSQNVVFPRLENLKLSLINIENIWPDQPLAMSSYIRSLKSLTAEECNDLKFLFSFSMVKSLVQLQKLVIGNCMSMEGVIDTEAVEGEKKLVEMSFPQLFYLKLKGLPELTRFGTGNLVEFPCLNELHIESCPNLKTFFSSSFCAGIVSKELEEMKLENDLTDRHHLFDEKVAFPSLEKMILLYLDNLQLIWHNHLHVDSFCKLKVLRIEFCEKITTILPSNTRGSLTFQNLEILDVKNCWSMKSLFPISIASGLMQLKELELFACGLEEIVAKEEVEGAPRFVFPQLTFLILEYLPDLRHFYLGLHTTEWPMLKWLLVDRCYKIKIFASEFPSFQKADGVSQPALFLFEKVIPNLEILSLDGHYITSICLNHIREESFCRLKALWLVFFDDESVAFPFGFLKKLYSLERLLLSNSNFKELFPHEGQIRKQDYHADPFLQNLQTLEVWRCDHMTYLMPPSAALKNLTSLDIWHCNGLANIVAYSAAKSLVQLTTMRIRECNLVTEIIAKEVDRTQDEIVFCQFKNWSSIVYQGSHASAQRIMPSNSHVWKK